MSGSTPVPQPVPLDALMEATRIIALRDAIVAAIGARRPECEVKGHPGKLDFSDVLAEDMFRAPAVAVAVTRARPEERLSGSPDIMLDVTAYVVAEDMMLGEPPRLSHRDEVAWAIALDLVALAGDMQASRWGLTGVSHPEDVEARTLFTAVSYKRGAVYFTVTWRQMLMATQPPLWGMDDSGLPPPGFGLGAGDAP